METKNTFGYKTQKGFSLIELMIAIPLGLLVMFAVLRIFTANIQGVSVQNAFSRVQESGRMSVELMTRDIRIADYWGCIHDITAIYDDSAQGISGEDNVSSTTIGGVDVKDNTDTLTLRGAKGFSSIKIKTAMESTTANIFLDFTDSTGIDVDDVLLISDNEYGDVFTNTSSIDGTISHASALQKAYGIDAQLLVPYIKTYFIGENDEGSYSLYRYDDETGDANEVVRGVNDLQLTYGEDTTGNDAADTFSDADSATDMDNVLFVRVQLVSDSESGTSGTSLERTYTTTATIRNRSLD